MRPLLNVLLRSVSALGVSALILFAIFVTYLETAGPEVARQAEPIDIPGSELQVVIGSAEPRGEHLDFTGFKPREGEYHAIAVWRGDIQAAKYPLLRYQLVGAQAPVRVKLFWLTKNRPDGFFIYDLNDTAGEPGWLDLDQLPDWQDTVVEIGVLVFVPSTEQEVSITRLTFTPLGWRAVLASQWLRWTSFRGWSGSSINYLPGTTARSGISPLPVVAAWSALAAILLFVAGFVGRKMHSGALVAVLLLPWIALDLQWQSKLSRQLDATRDQFAGKSVHEKHLADFDSPIYGYIGRLKAGILPEEPSRILLLHDSSGHNYARLKAQYYLLPHNVYNLGSLPPDYGFQGMDHILVLGDVAGLEFHSDTDTLVWNGGAMVLPVDLMDSDALGSVYRVRMDRARQEPQI